jgi:hypothetical protein
MYQMILKEKLKCFPQKNQINSSIVHHVGKAE